MITSNFFDDQMFLSAESGSFYMVSDSLLKYARTAEPHFSVCNGQGGNDHFISTMKAISDLYRNYSSENLESAIKTIKSTPCLMSWMSMIICMILFGRAEGNEICAERLSYENAPFLKVWKNKFFFSGKDDNYADEKLLSENPPSEGLNIYEFIKGEISSAAGCCSDKYYVIPPKETVPDNSKWKNFYFKLTASPTSFESIIGELDVKQKLLLKMSADSMPEDKPLKIIKDIICEILDYSLDSNSEVSGIELGNITFFKSDSSSYSQDILLEKLYMMDTDGKYAALFPFKEEAAGYIEKGKCCVERFRLKTEKAVDQHGGVYLRSAEISGDVIFYVPFVKNDGSTVDIKYRFKTERQYSMDDILNTDNLRTFCMYPDIPFEYEDMCREYTYFSNENSFVLNQMDTELLQSIDLAVRPGGKSDDTPLKCFQGIFDNAIRTFTRSKASLVTACSERPKHIIKVTAPDGKMIGSVLNLRTLDRRYKPFLCSGTPVDIDIRRSRHIEAENTMNVFVDFGSSSSASGYRINNGELVLNDITGGTPSVRELLAEYDKESYTEYLNLSGIRTGTIPSVTIKYDMDRITDIIPYHQAWTPYQKQFTSFELKRIEIDVSHKTGLLTSQISESPKMIISSLCFAALCHATEMGCGKVVFYPSLPNEKYADVLSHIWDDVLLGMKKVFTASTEHLLHAPDRHFLYESIAFSNGIDKTGNNILMVNIDMGDSTTDMSAVFTDAYGKKKICGYSSVEYAGKNLLKESLRNVISHMDSVKTAKAFMLGNEGKNPFIIKNSADSPAENIAENICMKFFPNSKRKGRPRNESWQNNFMELLEAARINTGSGENSADIKAKTDILLRYTIMMPVVRDFVDTSLRMCASDSNTAISIFLSGGAAKGILLADEFIGGENSYLERVRTYFREHFQGRYGMCDVNIPDTNAKEQLIRGLSRLSSENGSDGRAVIFMAENPSETEADWNEIDPKSVDILRNERRKEGCEGFSFRRIDTVDDISHNIEQRSKPESCIPKDVYGDLSNELMKLAEHFLFEDEFSDVIKGSFFTNANPLTVAEIKRQFYGGGQDASTSFRKAEQSEIYPEMIRSCAYMFETSRLLSEHFGRGFDGKAVIENAYEKDYNYGC